MAWMETLAKRQGADEGFTTTADMDVAEVDPSTVDEAILNQKYIPDGWTEERWEAHLKKEEEEKAARRAARDQAPPVPEPLPVPEPDPIADIIDEDDEELAFDLNLEGETQAVEADNPMSWLASLSETDEDSEELDMPDLSGLGDDLGGLSDLVSEDDGGDPMDWLASLAGDADDDAPDLGGLDDMSAGLEGLGALAGLGGDDDQDDEDESIVSLGDVDATDPGDFLESLARLQGADEDELSTDATTPIPDFLNLSDEDDLGEDIDMDDILEDTQPSEELDPAWMSDDVNSIDNPEAWLDSLATASNSSGNPVDMFGDDDDDYEDDEQLFPQDEDGTPDAVINALNSGQDVAPEDIQNFFHDMFDKANTEYAHLDNEPVEEDGDTGEVEDAVAIDMPDWLEELSGGATAQAVDDDEGEDLMADVLAGLDDDESGPDLPDVLDENEDVAEPIDIPDWLSDGAGDDTGDVIADIIADELDVAPGETAILSIGDKQIEVDPNDTWTQAFLMEDREETAEEWYTERINAIDVADALGDAGDDDVPEEDTVDDFETIQMTSPPGVASLEPATFPIEEDLPEGQPETAPEWLTGVPGEPVAEMPMDFGAMAADDTGDDIDMPDWLNESIDDDVDIPDWLTEADTDETDEVPDWLRDAGVEEVAEVPAWLTDTVEEPTDFIISDPEPEPQPAAIQPVRQAPIQVAPPAADIAVAIKSAQDKVAGDDLDGALADYESVVRANGGLDMVVGDLQKLTKDDKHKKNPAVYRVLGDAMMRKGDLQDALDVYRRALNLL